MSYSAFDIYDPDNLREPTQEEFELLRMERQGDFYNDLKRLGFTFGNNKRYSHVMMFPGVTFESEDAVLKHMLIHGIPNSHALGDDDDLKEFQWALRTVHLDLKDYSSAEQNLNGLKSVLTTQLPTDKTVRYILETYHNVVFDETSGRITFCGGGRRKKKGSFHNLDRLRTYVCKKGRSESLPGRGGNAAEKLALDLWAATAPSYSIPLLTAETEETAAALPASVTPTQVAIKTEALEDISGAPASSSNVASSVVAAANNAKMASHSSPHPATAVAAKANKTGHSTSVMRSNKIHTNEPPSVASSAATATTATTAATAAAASQVGTKTYRSEVSSISDNEGSSTSNVDHSHHQNKKQRANNDRVGNTTTAAIRTDHNNANTWKQLKKDVLGQLLDIDDNGLHGMLNDIDADNVRVVRKQVDAVIRILLEEGDCDVAATAHDDPNQQHINSCRRLFHSIQQAMETSSDIGKSHQQIAKTIVRLFGSECSYALAKAKEKKT
jgi:hypothetical protein